MAIAYLHEFPGGTHDQAQQLADRMEQQGDMPPTGGLFHAEGPMDGGWWAFDVWESEQSAREFYDGRLTPLLSELGMPPSGARMLDMHWHSNQPPGQKPPRSGRQVLRDLPGVASLGL